MIVSKKLHFIGLWLVLMAAPSLTEDRPFLQAEKLAISHGPYGMIRADVSKDRIQLKVTDIKGNVIDNLTVQAKAKK
jgi:hypothetical protein